jgi:hypothetical protein
LRQSVLVAAELEPVAARLRRELGLGEPFADPGVAEFGLINAVFALGDTFIEVISPSQPGTAAGRHLERHGGDGGYMVIFQLDDLDGARQRAQELGVRTVWQIDLPDISGTHLHPADMRGAIVSLDQARPAESWRWGGPEWIGRAGTGAPGSVVGARIEVNDPDAVAARWAQVLDVPVSDDRGGTPQLQLDGARVVFAPPAGEPERGLPVEPGLTEIEVALPPAGERAWDVVDIGGVRFRVTEEALVGP